MAKKWRCTVCGYIHEGPEAPDQCPMCKVGKEKFVELVEAEGDLDFDKDRARGLDLRTEGFGRVVADGVPACGQLAHDGECRVRVPDTTAGVGFVCPWAGMQKKAMFIPLSLRK